MVRVRLGVGVRVGSSTFSMSCPATPRPSSKKSLGSKPSGSQKEMSFWMNGYLVRVRVRVRVRATATAEARIWVRVRARVEARI